MNVRENSAFDPVFPFLNHMNIAESKSLTCLFSYEEAGAFWMTKWLEVTAVTF